ncbi:MAG: dockerin type I domain-containing protein [Verrucomicrobiota bacterium]|nr:dockerin type I domain-containing protein [Verrucomicrobiota bacterium]
MRSTLLKTRRPRAATYFVVVLLAAASSQAADVYWQLNVADPNYGFLWSAPQNWSTGALPGAGDNVIINANGGGELDLSLTIANLTVQRGEIDSFRNGSRVLTVLGTTSLELPTAFPRSTGIYAEPGTTYQLGTLANFSGGVLHGTTDNEFFTFGQDSAPAVIQFKGAHVIENEWALYLDGNGHFRDQDTGLDALRDLAVNRGDIYIVYGGSLNVSGNFTNDAQGSVDMGNRTGGINTFTVQGDFTNASTDSGLYLDSPAAATVNGNLTNYGYILLRERTGTGETASLTVGGTITMKSTGYLQLEGNASLNANGSMLFDRNSGMDLGGQPNVNTLYTTKLQIKNGIEFRGAYLTGTGTIFADVIFTQGGSVFSPGHSPGQVKVNGKLAFDAPTRIQMEIGGRTPGTEYDQIVQQSTGSGGVTLNGVLDVSFVNGFESSVQNSDVFSILTSDLALVGAFTNVANGGRLHVTNGSGSFVVTENGNSVVLSSFLPSPLTLTSAISRKLHGGTLQLDLPLALTAPFTVEPRGGALPTAHQLVLTFSNAIVSGSAAVTGGGGSVAGAPQIYGNTMTINLSNVANAQTVTVTVSNVTDTLGQVLPSATVSMRVLLGDSNGDGIVNAADASQTRNRSGEAASITNFLSDVNSDGSINSADSTIVRNASGSSAAALEEPELRRRVR